MSRKPTQPPTKRPSTSTNQIYSLTQDVTDNIILGQRMTNSHSDNTGQVIFDLTPDYMASPTVTASNS